MELELHNSNHAVHAHKVKVLESDKHSTLTFVKKEPIHGTHIVFLCCSVFVKLAVNQSPE